MTINHIALYVTDLKISTAFYKHIMQLPPIPEPFKMGKHSWFQISSGCQLHLIAGATEKANQIIHTHLAFTTTDMEEFVNRLIAANIVYGDVNGRQQTVQIRPDGIQQVFFQDPDGYWLEVNNDIVVPR